MQSDRDLEQRFSAARAADERLVPSFPCVLAARRQRAPVLTIRVAITAAIVAAVAVASWRLMTPNEPIIAFSAGDMRVPTDVLLETLSYPRAGDIPHIGTSDLLTPLADDASDTRRLP
jgi:hypothetical protein